VAVVEGIASGGKATGFVTFLISMIYGSVLGAILAAVANITLAVHMMIVKVNKPAVVVAVFKVILELVVFDILPMDDFYDWLEF
jgi:uncharacterized membrane-anchored protein YitT (DUF2179 family)